MGADPAPMSTWPQAFGLAAFMLVMAFALSAFFPAPWIILARWVDGRAEAKRILAQARLQEAKNAARKIQDTGGKDAP